MRVWLEGEKEKDTKIFKKTILKSLILISVLREFIDCRFDKDREHEYSALKGTTDEEPGQCDDHSVLNDE